MKNDVLYNKSFELSSYVIDICKDLNKTEWRVISNQLLKSGTSVGANIRESIYSESKKDFIHKLSLSRKEASECRYWLDLLVYKEIYEVNKKVFDTIDHIQRTISILIKSTKE